jgi:hypothetical protein
VGALLVLAFTAVRKIRGKPPVHAA